MGAQTRDPTDFQRFDCSVIPRNIRQLQCKPSTQEHLALFPWPLPYSPNLSPCPNHSLLKACCCRVLIVYLGAKNTAHTLPPSTTHSQLWLLSVWHGGEGAVCMFKHACTDRYMSACVFWDRVLLFCPGCPQTLCVTGGNTWVKAWIPNFSFSASKHWDAGVSYWTQHLPAFSSWNFCLLSIKQPRGFTHAKQTLVV